ncbi:MAG TPA: rod shape-determining protein MreC [Candidatus Fimivivens sp.]|nr:rod shape-determining protein MreC [Candidatus Fimivivens sp.]
MNLRGWPHSKFIRAIFALAILFGLALWNPTPLGPFLRGTFHTVLLPLEMLTSSFSSGIGDVWGFLSSIGSMKRENERLTEENIRFASENAQLAYLRTENDTLRKSVGLDMRKRYDLLAAQIVAAGGEGGRGSVIIDRGSMQGVRTGMTAIVGEGVLVGIVDETYPASARIALVTNSGTVLGGVTVENGSAGIVHGDRGLGVSYGMVLQSDQLAQGDRVMTSGAGGMVPSGLLVGTVSSVRDSGDRLFRESSILPPIDLGKLRFLYLIKE